MIPKIIDYEHHARAALLSERPLALDDKVYRALGLLRSARLMETEETLTLLSHVRLGVNLKRVKDLEINKVNELFLLTQQAHLQKILGKKLEGDARRARGRNSSDRGCAWNEGKLQVASASCK